MGARVEPSPPTGGDAGSTRAPMTRRRRDADAVRHDDGFTRRRPGPRPAQGLRRAAPRSTAWTSRWRAARCSRCSGPTAPARRRWSRSSKATAAPTPARSPCSATTPASASGRSARGSGSCCRRRGLDPAIKVREAIELYGAAYPHPRPAGELLELVGLGDRADVPRRGPLRRPAPPARPRARPRRRPRADLPRRADHGLRPGRAAPVVGDDRQPARARQVDPADHALHGGGAAPRRPRRRARPRARRRRGHAGRAGPRRATPSSASALPASTRRCRCPRRDRRARHRAASAPRRRRATSRRCSSGPPSAAWSSKA